MAAFVFASVTIPVALAQAREREVVNKVVVVQSGETEQLYIKQSISFDDQVEAFAIADLNTKVPRNAYPAELSVERILEKANDFLTVFLEPFREEYKELAYPSMPTIETILTHAVADAVLYESPSGSGKVAYWQINYSWDYASTGEFKEETWPIYYMEIECDTWTGNLFSVEYSYYPFVCFSDPCGVEAFVKASGIDVELEASMPYEYNPELAQESSSYVFADDWKMSLCYALKDVSFSVAKSMFHPGEGRDRIQFVPNGLIN